MSICNPCVTAKKLIKCFDTLTIGTAIADTDYIFYAYDHTTSRLQRIEVTSDNTGAIILNANDIIFFPDHSYECWITLADAVNSDERQHIIIDGEEQWCVYLRFQNLYTGQDTNTFINQVVKSGC